MGKRASAAFLSFSASVLLGVLLAACNGGSPSQEPTPTEAPSPSPVTVTVEPTPTASPEEAVLRAYLRYWEVYSEALFSLDTNRLSEVMTGPRLERALEEVGGLRELGRAVRIVVANRPVVVQVRDEAVLLDEYENRSYLIDAVTKEPLSEPPATGETIRDTVTLTRVGATWKVLDTVREVGQ